MKLTKILFEMAVDDALNIFNIKKDDIGNKDLIKKRYRELSLLHHPDHGGSTEMMKKINDAKKTLDIAKSAGVSWDDINEKYRKLGETIKNLLLNGFKPDNYIAYFDKIYNDNFEHTFLRTFPLSSEKNPSYAGFKSEFFNNDRSIVFELDISSYLANASSTKTLGGVDKNISFPLWVIAFGFYNNRKLKVSQRDWKSTNNHKVLSDPESAFPKNKLEKFKTTSVEKSFQKKDMITYLTKKLKGSWDGTWVKIPLTDELKIYFERYVFLRTASWNPILFKGYKGIPGGRYKSFPETLETAKYFENLVNGLINKKNEDDIIKYFNKEINNVDVKKIWEK